MLDLATVKDEGGSGRTGLKTRQDSSNDTAEVALGYSRFLDQNRGKGFDLLPSDWIQAYSMNFDDDGESGCRNWSRIVAVQLEDGMWMALGAPYPRSHGFWKILHCH